MAKRTPKTRYPWSAERFYARQLNDLVNQLGKLTLSIFDEQIKAQINLYKMRTDAQYRADAPLDVIRQAIELIKGLTLGIFSSDTLLKIATRFMNTLNQQSKTNAKAQGRVHGIDPTQREPWLDEFMRNTIHENVSYISSISDEYFPKIENIIYQGAKKGSSIADIRNQLVERIGMAKNRATFIAVDQTGTIFGQMTAKRHQEMGVPRFTWSTSHDNKVRKTHRELDGHEYSYSDPPAEGLPGTPYRCRCVAIPVFDE